MSILSRLCRYVHTYGYSSSPVEAPVGIARRGVRLSRKQRYAQACLEQMEARVLLTTLTHTGALSQTYYFNDFAKKTISVTLNGNITVDLYGTTPDGASLSDMIQGVPPPALSNATHPSVGTDIFAMYIENSDINSYISISGEDLYTGGISSLYSGITGSPGLPIGAPTGAGQVYIGYHSNGTPVSNIPGIYADDANGVLTGGAQTLATNNGGTNPNTGDFLAGVYSAQTVGKVLIDGTVTGAVNVTGSVGTFYCGWLVTGDVTANSNDIPDNFAVSGDVGSLLVRTDIGSNITPLPANGSPFFDALTQIHIGGRIGTMTVGDSVLGSVVADKAAGNASLSSAGFVWNEPTQLLQGNANTAANRLSTFASGLVVITNVGDPFFNETFATATYLGSLGTTNGTPSITVQGTIQGFENGSSLNKVDYYAVGMLAGQTMTATVTSGLIGSTFGVFDNDGRLIYTAETNASGVASITFTADRPGAYRIAMGLPNDFTLAGTPTLLTDYAYTMTVTGMKDMAIGGMHVEGDLETQGVGIEATNGDIGAIVSDGKQLSVTFSSITVDNGNLLDMEASQYSSTSVLGLFPTINVNGTIGLIHAAGLFATDTFASGNIQVLASEGEMVGSYVSNASIGVIRAGSMTNRAVGITTTGQTLFQVNADDLGAPGTIDLIDVAGDLGTINTGGPRIETGIGGNVRFMQVTGSIFQDSAFGGGGTSTIGSTYGDGGIAYAAGQTVQLTDDSGAAITLIPQAAQTVTTQVGNATVTTTTPAGQITAYTYGIYGAGGVVLVKAISDETMTIRTGSSSSNPSQSADIGQVIMTGQGAALTTNAALAIGNGTANGTGNGTANGTFTGVVLPANNPAAAATSLNTLTITGSVSASVFNVTSTGTLNSLIDSTGGDLVTVHAVNLGGANQDIGTLTVSGNIGSTYSSTGAILNQAAVMSNAYPFQQQHIGIIAANIVSITSGQSVGNIMASGAVGSIAADSGGAAVKGALFGITGPVVVGGNLGTVNIGNGVATDGFSAISTTEFSAAGFSRAGIYAGGAIVRITGNNADIRGQIISTSTSAQGGIQTIALTNGSLIGAEVGVYTNFAQASPLAGRTTPQGGNINAPLYNVQNITISGNGGIIGTLFEASNIGNITVNSGGFGILNSSFITPADGVVRSVSAAGYGVRGTTFNGANLLNVTATGDGSVASPSQYSVRVRNSEGGATDPYTGLPVSPDVDLTQFLTTIGDGDSDYRTGIISNEQWAGQNLGNVTAFAISGGSSTTTTVGGIATPTNLMSFANSIGNIKVASTINDLSILSGRVGSITTGGSVTDINWQFSGAVGTIYIGGSFLRSSPTATSLILAKGASSSIKSLTVAGDFSGTLTAQGPVTTLTLGTPGKKGSIGSGNLTAGGSIQLLSGSSVKNLVFNSGLAGNFEVSGNVGSVTFAQGLAATATFTVHGSLAKLTIGGDKSGTNIGLRGSVVVQGTLGQLLGGGAFTGSITATGNLGKVKFAGSYGGATTVNGSIGSMQITGDIVGAILANGGIGAVKLSGSITSTGSLRSNGASISSLTIGKGGSLDGRLNAVNIGKLVLPTMGSNANVTANSLGSLLVQGSTAGGHVAVTTGIGSISASSLSHTVITAGQNIASIKIKGDVGSSVIQSGITAGSDGKFGTADSGEGSALGTLGKVTIGSLTNSVVAAGGAIGSILVGPMVDSSISSGLVVQGAALQNVISGANLLATPADVNTLRVNPTLFFGNIGLVSVAKGAEGGLDASSFVTAGVSPGPNGIFGDASDSSIPPSAVGSSAILQEKIAADALVRVLAHG